MAVENSAYEKGKTKKAAVPKKPPQPDAINIDFSADYAVGQGLADRRLQAVNAGYRDRMKKNQEFLCTAFFTEADTFQIGTTYTRSLPSVEAREATNNSLMAMLYGTEEITQDEG